MILYFLLHYKSRLLRKMSLLLIHLYQVLHLLLNLSFLIHVEFNQQN